MKRKTEMDFKTYAFAQFAIGNDAKFAAMVSFALDTVATVQGWSDTPRKTRAECESALSIAMTLAKVPETTARRYLATVSGLALQFTKEHKATLESVKAAMVQADETMTPEGAVAELSAVLKAEGVVNLAYLETYARKGKVGVAGLAAEYAARVAAIEAKASATEAEAAEAAKAEAAEAEAAKAEASPRAKAAKQAAAILGSIAKHGDNMTADELRLIASAVAEAMAKAKALDNLAGVLTQQAEGKRITAEVKAEEKKAA